MLTRRRVITVGVIASLIVLAAVIGVRSMGPFKAQVVTEAQNGKLYCTSDRWGNVNIFNYPSVTPSGWRVVCMPGWASDPCGHITIIQGGYVLQYPHCLSEAGWAKTVCDPAKPYFAGAGTSWTGSLYNQLWERSAGSTAVCLVDGYVGCSLKNGPMLFRADGALCASSTECYPGPYDASDRPYPSLCLDVDTSYHTCTPGTSGCAKRCAPVVHWCGDGIKQSLATKLADNRPDDGVDEQCDDGNSEETDGCTTHCITTSSSSSSSSSTPSNCVAQLAPSCEYPLGCYMTTSTTTTPEGCEHHTYGTSCETIQTHLPPISPVTAPCGGTAAVNLSAQLFGGDDGLGYIGELDNIAWGIVDQAGQGVSTASFGSTQYTWSDNKGGTTTVGGLPPGTYTVKACGFTEYGQALFCQGEPFPGYGPSQPVCETEDSVCTQMKNQACDGQVIPLPPENASDCPAMPTNQMPVFCDNTTVKVLASGGCPASSSSNASATASIVSFASTSSSSSSKETIPINGSLSSKSASPKSSSSSSSSTVCGDGTVQGAEECDWGIEVGQYTCEGKLVNNVYTHFSCDLPAPIGKGTCKCVPYYLSSSSSSSKKSSSSSYGSVSSAEVCGDGKIGPTEDSQCEPSVSYNKCGAYGLVCNPATCRCVIASSSSSQSNSSKSSALSSVLTSLSSSTSSASQSNSSSSITLFDCNCARDFVTCVNCFRRFPDIDAEGSCRILCAAVSSKPTSSSFSSQPSSQQGSSSSGNGSATSSASWSQSNGNSSSLSSSSSNISPWSASSSLHSGSAQSSSAVFACSGGECAEWGNDICATLQRQCIQLTVAPCAECSLTPISSSRSFSSAGSLASSLPSACLGDECSIGGSAFCALQGRLCSPITTLPCIQCLGSSSSFSFSSHPSSAGSAGSSAGPFACLGTECAMGGDSFCALQGGSCIQIPELPCVQCIASTSQSSSVFSSPFALEELSPCVDDRDCTGGLHCYEGTCHFPCLTDVDCRPQERCLDRFCRSRVEIALLPDYCGNARVDAGEQCDDGLRNADTPNALCRSDCSLARCGDSILDTPLETCDDGNNTPNDGCSNFCKLEHTAAPPAQTLPAAVIELPFVPAACQQDTDCAAGYICQNGKCVFNSLCRNAADCPSGFECKNGICIMPSTSTFQSPQTTSLPPQTTDTGPATLALMAAGAAAGWAWMRKKRK